MQSLGPLLPVLVGFFQTNANHCTVDAAALAEEDKLQPDYRTTLSTIDSQLRIYIWLGNEVQGKEK